VQRFIEDPLSEEMLLGRFQAGDAIVAELEPGTETVIFRRNNIGDDPQPQKELALN